jgi:hypothetical protein
MSDEINELKDEEKEKLNEEMGGNGSASESEGSRLNSAPNSAPNSAWIGGAVLILIGLYFLMGNLFGFGYVANWWAFFILIPAVYSLSRAWTSYRRHGRLTDRGQGNLIGGLLMLAVALIFLFGLSFGNWWPVFLIIAGVGALLKVRG